MGDNSPKMRSPSTGEERKKKPRPRKEGEEEDRERRHHHRPRRPPDGGGDGNGNDDEERRKRRPSRRRPSQGGGDEEHRRSGRQRRTVGGEGGDDEEHRRRRPRRPNDGEREHRGRSLSQSQRKHRSGEERRAVSVSERGTRKVRKPRPPEESDDEERRRRMMRKKKQRDMNNSVESLRSTEDLDDKEFKKQRRLKKKKNKDLDSSVGTLSTEGSEDKDIMSPRISRTSPANRPTGVGIDGGDIETPRTRERKKKLRPREEGMNSSTKNDVPIPNSAASFDVEAFMKRQQAKQAVVENDGSTSSNPSGFDVADFVKRQQANKINSNNINNDNGQSKPTNGNGNDQQQQQQQQRAEDAKKIASLETQVESLNKQLEQQELELAASINEMAAHEETKKELDYVREQLQEFEDARGSSSMDFLTDQLEEQRQKLEQALKAAEIGEEARKEMEETQTQFNAVIDEKDDLLKALDSAEQEMGVKENRIMSLEKAVESQLDTIEALEDKLETTEDELFQMEEDLKTLQKKGILDESVHSKDRERRIDYLRSDRTNRANSIRVEKSHSQNLLSSSSHHSGISTRGEFVVLKEESPSLRAAEADLDKRRAELDSLEKELAERKRTLDVKREQDELQGMRLEEWEQDLMEKEAALKGSDASNIGENGEVGDMLKELDEKDRMLKETREALVREKRESMQARREAEELQKRMDDGAMNGHSHTQSTDIELATAVEEKEKQIASLEEMCQQLEDEKVEIIRNQEQEDIQRDEELRKIQQDIHEKLQELNFANQDLRRQLEESEQKAMKVSGLQKVINLLEDEVRSLRRVEGGEEGEQAMAQHRDAVARQLADLDEDNQNLSEQVTKQKQEYEGALEEKAEKISELEQMLNDAQRKLQSASSGGGAFTASLLKEVSELKQKLKAAENGEGGAAKLAKQLKEKDALIKDLNEAMMKLKLDKDNSVAADQEERVLELEEQLAAMKAEFASRASKDTLAKLKDEIKSLKDTVRDLKQELKTEKHESEAKMKKKDENIAFFQGQMMKLTQDLARVKKTEQRRPGFLKAMGGGVSAELQQQVGELEEEVDTLKASNMQLEDEIAVLKAERIELKNKLTLSKLGNANNIDSEVDDDEGSIGPPIRSPIGSPKAAWGTSVSSDMDERNGDFKNSSNMNILGNASISSATFNANEASQRAMRTIGGLWNAVKTQQPPNGPRGLYSHRSNDD